MEHKYRVVVAGGRDYPISKFTLRRLKLTLDNLSTNPDDILLISGNARGADQVPYQMSGYTVEGFPAEWDKYGKSAGYIRNQEMAERGTHLIAYWDGKSKGTGHMISLARENGCKVCIIRYSTVHTQKPKQREGV